MKIDEALKVAKSKLHNLQDRSSVAKRLMMFYTGFSLEQLFLNLQKQIEQDGYFKLIDRFKNGEPLEYITGTASFYSLEFNVFKGVLIPRPETEILVQKVIDISKKFKNPKIAEIGTGTGIISIILALNLNCKIVATDINDTAISNAKFNANKFKVSDKIDFLNCSYLDDTDDKFDILVSNPPYIADDYNLDIWVNSEPHNALFGGKNGDEILKEIINLADKKEIKTIACEMGYDQKISMQNELDKFGYKAEFYKDLAGFDRGFIAYKI